MRGWPARTPRTPRALLATLAVGALAVTGIGSDAASTPTPAVERPDGRTNILLITADDLAVRDLAFMPKTLELLQEGGVAFGDALAPTPICVPARASLLTGQYAHNHGAVTITGHGGGYASFDDTDTVPVALQKVGYDTLFAGKYINGYGKVNPLTGADTEHDLPPGWTDWRATIDPSTYRFDRRRMNINGEVRRVPGYATKVMTEQTQDMITDDRDGRPWFAWVNYVAPHVGGPEGPGDPRTIHPKDTRAAFKTTVPADEDRGYYQRVSIPNLPYSFPDDTDDLAKANKPSHRRFTKVEKRALRTVYQRRIEAARGIDRGVAALVDTLAETGQLDRTLVVFTSDNGFTVDAHNLNGKLYPWDDSLRIPVLMRGPDLPQGHEVSTAVTNPDLAATFLGVAGAEVNHPLDGVDILPWIKVPAQVRAIPIEGWPGGDGSRRLYMGVRLGAWTYVRFRGGEEELYDRATDEYEMRNLAHDPASKPVLLALKRLAVRYRDCMGAQCPQEFYPAAWAADPTRFPG
ncbi:MULTISPECIES: sulfatase-like hydrolase/transferase [unclassified Nocardioides]|uniref:sulfatase-like hydrolase/transferase n=1 Tax=unclassified Nocardioides TaxID=2615069 RepID=UPI003014CF3F